MLNANNVSARYNKLGNVTEDSREYTGASYSKSRRDDEASYLSEYISPKNRSSNYSYANPDQTATEISSFISKFGLSRFEDRRLHVNNPCLEYNKSPLMRAGLQSVFVRIHEPVYIPKESSYKQGFQQEASQDSYVFNESSFMPTTMLSKVNQSNEDKKKLVEILGEMKKEHKQIRDSLMSSDEFSKINPQVANSNYNDQSTSNYELLKLLTNQNLMMTEATKAISKVAETLIPAKQQKEIRGYASVSQAKSPMEGNGKLTGQFKSDMYFLLAML